MVEQRVSRRRKTTEAQDKPPNAPALPATNQLEKKKPKGTRTRETGPPPPPQPAAPAPAPALPEQEAAPQCTVRKPMPPPIPEPDPAPASRAAAPTAQVGEFTAPPTAKAPHAGTDDATIPFTSRPQPAGAGDVPPLREPRLDKQAMAAASSPDESGPKFILEPEGDLPPGEVTSEMPRDTPASPETARSPHAGRLLLGALAAGLLVTVIAVKLGGDKSASSPDTAAPVPAAHTDSRPTSVPEPVVMPAPPPQDTTPAGAGSELSPAPKVYSITPETKPTPPASASRKPRPKPKPDNNCKNLDANERDASCVFK
jgi:hypothetical protein